MLVQIVTCLSLAFGYYNFKVTTLLLYVRFAFAAKLHKVANGVKHRLCFAFCANKSFAEGEIGRINTNLCSSTSIISLGSSNLLPFSENIFLYFAAILGGLNFKVNCLTLKIKRLSVCLLDFVGGLLSGFAGLFDLSRIEVFRGLLNRCPSPEFLRKRILLLPSPGAGGLSIEAEECLLLIFVGNLLVSFFKLFSVCAGQTLEGFSDKRRLTSTLIGQSEQFCRPIEQALQWPSKCRLQLKIEFTPGPTKLD